MKTTINFSKFKKTAHEGDKATLQHPHGHSITIAISALSPEHQKTIKAMPLADGGKVEAMGNWKTKAESEHRKKHMEAAEKYINKKFNLPVERAPGKFNASGKLIDKPDLTNERGAIQHIGNPDSLVHEMGHMVVVPKGMGLTEYQELMDKKWGQYNKSPEKGGYGYKQHARTKDEYETTALENPLRRRMGLPAHQKETKETGDKRMMAADVPGKQIVKEIPNGKRLTGTHENISPEARKRLQDIDENITRYHPQHGLVDSMSPDALINLRGQGRHEEAQHRLKHRGEERYAEGGDVEDNRYNPKLVESHKLPNFDEGGEIDPELLDQMPTAIDGVDRSPAGAWNTQPEMNLPPEPVPQFAPTSYPQGSSHPQSVDEMMNTAQGNQSDRQPDNVQISPEQAQQFKHANWQAAVDHLQDKSEDPRFASAPAVSQSPAPQNQDQPLNVNTDYIAKGVGMQAGGLHSEAKALGKIGREQAVVYDQQNQQANQNQMLFQNHIADNENERQAIANDIQEMHIDPLKYIHDMGTGQKIATGIGLILGGMGGGLTHQENPAMKFLQAQINNSVEGQKMELGKKENLLSANLKRFQNIRDAADFTRVNLNDMVARQIAQAAAKNADPLAQARAQQAIGQLYQQSGMILGRVNAMQVINDPRAGDRDINNALATLRFVNPEAAKEAEQRVVPGIGVSQTGPVPQATRDTLVAMKTLNDRANDLMHDVEVVHSNPALLANLQLRATLNTKAHEVLSFLGSSMDMGILSKGKMPYLESQIGNPVGLIDNLIRDNTKLKETLNGNQRRYDIQVQSAGIPLKHGSIIRGTPSGNGGQGAAPQGFVPKSFQPIK